MFRGWFRMHARCPHCDAALEREPGFFLGSIYFNYGLTAVIATAGYMVLVFGLGTSPARAMWGLLAFCLLFPLWFFRYARSLWLGFDEYFDPRQS